MTEQGERNSRHRIRSWHVAVFVLGALVITFAVFRIVVRTKVNRRLDAVRAAGYPATCEELDASYTIPAFAENAADYITTALSHLISPSTEDANGVPLFSNAPLPRRRQALDNPTKHVTASMLAGNQKTLELLRQGLAIPDCRYPVDFTQGNDAELIDLAAIRRTTRLLVMGAVLHAEQDDPNTATRMLLSSYGLARTLVKLPTIISQVVAQADLELTAEGLEQVVNRTTLTDAHLVQIDAALYEGDDPDSMVRALAAERCFGLHMADEPSNYGPGNLSVAVAGILRELGVVDLSLIRHLDRMAEAIEIAQMEPWKQQKAIETAEARYNTSGISSILDWLTPPCARLIGVNVQGMARMQVARTAVAVERYRLATAQLPQDTTDLVPGYLETTPIDPFDGRPLRYKKRDGGYVVYSIGPDGTDDGGTERHPKRQGGKEDLPYDITFIVER